MGGLSRKCLLTLSTSLSCSTPTPATTIRSGLNMNIQIVANNKNVLITFLNDVGISKINGMVWFSFNSFLVPHTATAYYPPPCLPA